MWPQRKLKNHLKNVRKVNKVYSNRFEYHTAPNGFLFALFFSPHGIEIIHIHWNNIQQHVQVDTDTNFVFNLEFNQSFIKVIVSFIKVIVCLVEFDVLMYF